MKPFITGARDSIGRALLERYRATGADVGGVEEGMMQTEGWLAHEGLLGEQRRQEANDG